MISNGPAAVYTVADFVRRVVDSLLRGDCRGMFLCARCLVKLTRDHLDKSYSKTDITQVMDEIFNAPGALTYLAASACGACGRKKAPCLGVAPQAQPQPRAHP
ncbi:MAG TPA: hypothetical protein VL086_01025 [Candidatus Nitrosotalea sp.]|nr:hypothetical protein [Candidatus Nitrosotalea sp.]